MASPFVFRTALFHARNWPSVASGHSESLGSSKVKQLRFSGAPNSEDFGLVAITAPGIAFLHEQRAPVVKLQNFARRPS
jgi:hypothetical protein